MTPLDRSTIVKRLAAQRGFDRCGIARLGPIPRGDYYLDWLARGQAGTMGYLHRRRESRLDPSRLLPGACSAIVVAVNYHQRADPVGWVIDPPAARATSDPVRWVIDPPAVSATDSVRPESAHAHPSERTKGGSPTHPTKSGRIALYAWGEDYHVVVRERLDSLLAALRVAVPEPFDAKICVDTSAVIERELAAAAGIGWIGKNTLVLHQSLGSYFFLGEILTTLDLAPDDLVADHCGRCTRCLDACPTQAFPAPYQMDATRCISYLTIEHRREIPADLQPQMGEWIFGCDVCQQVCPFNADAPRTNEPRFAVRPPAPTTPLAQVAAWDESAHAAATQGRALDRATLPMWRRNAEIALRNAMQGESC